MIFRENYLPQVLLKASWLCIQSLKWPPYCHSWSSDVARSLHGRTSCISEQDTDLYLPSSEGHTFVDGYKSNC